MARFGYCALVIAVALALITGASGATNLEFPVWERSYSGSIAGKPVSVNLTLTDDRLSGYYCYAPCSTQKDRLFLEGTLQDKALMLRERTAKADTGVWQAELTSEEIKGEWSSADKKRRYPIAISYNKVANDPQIALTLVVAKEDRNFDPSKPIDCNNVPSIAAIKLYRNGSLLQTLATESEGTCNVFLPQWVDVNFDGFPDLTIAQFLPAGPNIPHQTWLYDPQQKRYIDAPESYQMITSPEVDPDYQQIVSHWRGSCCSHGINVYRWEGKEVKQVDGGESYLQPVLSNGKMFNCYIIPEYGNGHVIYPVRRQKDRLTPYPADETCEAFQLAPGVRTVIQPDKDEGEPEVIEIQWREEPSLPGRYCPVIPFIDEERLAFRQITDREIDGICMNRAEFEASGGAD